jgi:hypothetical protein
MFDLSKSKGFTSRNISNMTTLLVLILAAELVLLTLSRRLTNNNAYRIDNFFLEMWFNFCNPWKFLYNFAKAV